MGMETHLLLTPLSPNSAFFLGGKPLSLSPPLPITRRCCIRAVNSDSGNDSSNQTPSPSPPLQPPAMPPPPSSKRVEIRYRLGSRKRAKQEQSGIDGGLRSKPDPPKDWDSMTISEKATELYMGEKGLLFWLNKFAYASIFIIIGGWILFRFVGPNIGLYQLDAPPLSPSNILK